MRQRILPTYCLCSYEKISQWAYFSNYHESFSSEQLCVRNQKTFSSDLVNLENIAIFMMKLRSHYVRYSTSLLQAGHFKRVRTGGTDASQEVSLLVFDASSAEICFWDVFSDWATLSFLAFFFTQYCSCLNLLFLFMFHPVLFSLISRLWAVLPSV